ncbi:unnamed protein product [Bursaphelenchus xylophilus]|uniref:(pine wood nematode) hypothetical protein n=1 Tax=Bursaphelenchus xylophilus TaxID=6326 RepID=A0A1I7SLG9_BURXY|nr:unnamed protein product [Bursaphelenchus xylophilus]CAG9129587.1 unnamed protein product [Bursaphelenchus xylophilus]
MSVRKGRGSQVFTQEMACALVEMYSAKKREYPGGGYSLPPEGFEAIVLELREKFNVGPNEIDQQTLKKKLSNIRTRVRNRCKDIPADADLTTLNLTPSEQIYFRYFGCPNALDNNNRSGDGEGVSPVPNGLEDHRPVNGIQNDFSTPNDLPRDASIMLMRHYGEHLHLFTEQSIQIKDIDRQRDQLFHSLAELLARDFKIQWSTTQVQDKIDEVARSLGRKIEDCRRMAPGAADNSNLILRPPDLTPAEAELFDAQYQERSPPKEIPPSSSAGTLHIPASVATDHQNLMSVGNDFYQIIVPSNGIPPEASLPNPLLYNGINTATAAPLHVSHEVTIPHNLSQKAKLSPKRPPSKPQKRPNSDAETAQLSDGSSKRSRPITDAEILMLEKQRTLLAERTLAEESLVLVRKQLGLLERQEEYYRTWTEIGKCLRGFLRI